MQKFSSYLYPNRINLVADVALFPVRWNIVYQNRIKIYQGIDNVLTLDVKNADQKRIDISSMDLKMCITDVNGFEFLTADVTPGGSLGLATVTIPASSPTDELNSLTPQFLNFTIYDNTTKTLLYADTQFGAKGNMELVGSALPVEFPARYIKIFNPLRNDYTTPASYTFYSEAVQVRMPNFLKDQTLDSLDLEFKLSNLAAAITVQYTEDEVVSTGTIWKNIETFSVTDSTTTLNKTYNNPIYTRDMSWVRVTYVREENNTGKLDSIVVRV